MIITVRSLFLSAIFITLLIAPTSVFASPVEIVQSYFAAIERADYEAAAKLFKFPNYSNPVEYENDVKTVSADLKDVVSDFGRATPISQANAVEGSFAGFGVSAGSPEHVEQYPPQDVLHFRVNFSNGGQGYISFLFNSNELIMVFYSIPEDKVNL
jgi:hypothetical protein